MSSRRFSTALGAAMIMVLPASCGRSSQSSGQSTPEGVISAAPTGSDPEAPAGPEDAAPRDVTLTLADVGLDPASLDRTAEPCADFYQFACGGWEEAARIPAGAGRWTRFSDLRQRNREALRAILDETGKRGAGGDAELARLGTYYAACMDEAAADAVGTAALDALLAAARAVKNRDTLAAALAAIHRYGIPAVFDIASAPDFQDPTTEILFLDSAGFALPDRDYYLMGKERHASVRKAYRAHVQRMFAALGMPKKKARRAAADVLRIETDLACAAKSRLERSVIARLYNRVDREGLAALAPRFPWAAYFAGIGHPDIAPISVTTPRFFKAFNRLVKRVKPKAWSHYLQWQILHATAPTLPAAFANEHFAFRAKALRQKQSAPRWMRCVGETSEAMGDSLGRAFVRRRFGERGRETAILFVREIRAAFQSRLEAIGWMSHDARKAALAKLAEVSVLVGYPERWESDDFAVEPGSYAANALAARAADTQRTLARVGKPADRTRWHARVHVANASYNWLANQLTLPAGFLQPPFFSARHSIPVNLGAMGAIAGHELTHAFDDRGAMFDGTGRMKNWWHADDAKRFKKKSRCFIEQFGKHKALPGLRLDGRMSLSENVADLGGLRLAFAAHRKLGARDDKTVEADGFTEDQQFFLAAGQAWCGKTRDAEVRRLAAGGYVPPRVRVNATMANLPEFAEAFDCKAGSPMRRDPVCEMW